MKIQLPRIAVLSFFLIVSLGSTCFYLSRLKMRNPITDIPQHDRRILENFFRQMQTRDSMAYVLMGTKPMMVTDFNQLHPEAKNYPHNEILKKGWLNWKKYETRFPHPNFIFRIFGDLNQDEVIDIVLINKKNFKEEFEKYPDEYALLTGNSKIDLWLQAFEKSLITFSECFQKNHVLKGIAFGFGKHNAITFENNSRIFSELREKYPNEGPDFIDEKLETSKGRITVTGFMDTNPEAIKQMILPRCAVVPEHQETLALQKRYENDREKIIGILGQNDFLEAVIGSLTSE